MKSEKGKNRKNTHERLTNRVNAVGEVLLGFDITIIIFMKTLSNGVLNVTV
jgi:hypothetical protein